MRHAIRRRVDTGLLVGVAGRGAAGLGAASMLMQVTMNWAQKTVSSTGATVIYASEPVWGGIIGRIAGERHPGMAHKPVAPASVLWDATTGKHRGAATHPE